MLYQWTIPMPRSVNGFGTRYYGRREEALDGSYVTTVWITALYIPILPLRSYRVLPVGKSFNVIIHRSQQFKALRVPLCWEQVWHVYMISAPILLIIAGLIWSSAKKQSERKDFGQSVQELSRLRGEKGGIVERSDEESIARVEHERARLQPDEQLVVIMQDVYPHWNTYTVSLTPQNEQATLKNLSADSVKLAERKPTRQWVIVFRSRTDEPAVWSHIKKLIAEGAAK